MHGLTLYYTVKGDEPSLPSSWVCNSESRTNQTNSQIWAHCNYSQPRQDLQDNLKSRFTEFRIQSFVNSIANDTQYHTHLVVSPMSHVSHVSHVSNTPTLVRLFALEATFRIQSVDCQSPLLASDIWEHPNHQTIKPPKTAPKLPPSWFTEMQKSGTRWLGICLRGVLIQFPPRSWKLLQTAGWS